MIDISGGKIDESISNCFESDYNQYLCNISKKINNQSFHLRQIVEKVTKKILFDFHIDLNEVSFFAFATHEGLKKKEENKNVDHKNRIVEKREIDPKNITKRYNRFVDITQSD